MAASDALRTAAAPLKAQDIAKLKRGARAIPMTAGTRAVAFNQPGCTGSLSCTGTIVS